MLSQSPLGFVGARKIDQLPPDQPVLFVWHPSSSYGYIIGAAPELRISQTSNYSDRISLSSRCGIHADPIHQTLLGLPEQGSVSDWSANRPDDALGGGEGGLQAETGVGSFVDSEMAFQRANEDTGVWHFRGDDLTRLAGRNLQIRSAVSESEELEDQGEATRQYGESPYFWERLGAWSYGQPVFQAIDPLAADPTLGQAPLEPMAFDQQPFDRVAGYGGYLGQGGRRAVCLPPAPPDQIIGLNTYSTDRILPGVFSEQIALTGAYRLASAHSLLLSKRVTQPVPRRRMRAEDAQGDNPSNYRAAGLLGKGPPHLAAAEPASATAGTPAEVGAEAAAADDRYAYAYAWENLLPFRMHVLDWFTPDESNMGIFGSTQQEPVNFAALAQQPFLPAPIPVQAWVDHRYGSVKFYVNSSSIELTQRGSVLIRDGFGGAVDMIGGNIIQSCPGDIVLRPGGRLVIMAGKDICARAADSVDVSATNNDVRIRAGGRLKMKGAGVEVFSDDDVTVRALNGNTRIWTDNFYLKTGGDPSNPNPHGSIHLDAGAGTVTVVARTMQRFLISAAFDCFCADGVGDPAEGLEFATVNVYSSQGAQIDGDLFVDGCAAASGNVYTGSWFVATDGHIATSLSASYNYLAGGLTAAGVAQAAAVITAGQAAELTAISAADAAFDAIYTNCLYFTDGDGNTAVIDDTVFMYRAVTDYGTGNYFLFESPWQQQARLQGATAGLKVWNDALVGETLVRPMQATPNVELSSAS